MTRGSYISQAKKLQFLGGLIFIFVGWGLAGGVSLWLVRDGGLVQVIRERLSMHVHPDWIGVVGILPLIPILVSPIVLALLLVKLLDRRIGVRCPHCGKSLTLRCHYRVVANTGQCELCHESVFDQAGEKAEPFT